MTYPIFPMLGITLSLTAIAGSVMAIPNFLPKPEANNLGNIEITSLWTSHPVSVDPSKQNFERLPALVVQPPKTAELRPVVERSVAGRHPSKRYAQPDLLNEDETETAVESPPNKADMEVAAWCAERYRSYRASDNTYLPYSGARRQCEPPFKSSGRNTVAADISQPVSGIVENAYSGDTHAQWCFARYRSYNPDKNIYLSFSGEIRSCISPYI
jgi:BA14K-like protein